MVSLFRTARKLIFGEQSLACLARELSILDVKNPLIVTEPIFESLGLVALVKDNLQGLKHGVFDRVQPEPEIDLLKASINAFKSGQHDAAVALGGGSAMDLAKATATLAYRDSGFQNVFGEQLIEKKGAPIICLPTTAGTGSEVTNIAVFTDTTEQLKKGIVSDFMLPDLSIVDPALGVSAPPHVTAACGIDALVHAMESYISKSASPLTDAIAHDAMAMIFNNLPIAYAQPENMEARTAMANASMMAGMAFGNAGVGAVHALAYPLGGRYHLSHGVSNALMLVPVMASNKNACLTKFNTIASAFGLKVANKSETQVAEAIVAALGNLVVNLGIAPRLRDYNIERNALKDMAVDAAGIERLMRNNPVQYSVEQVESIYNQAF